MPRRHLSFVPLIGFVVPTVVIALGFVIPGSGIEGVNDLTLGLASTGTGACVTCGLGLRALARDTEPPR